MRCNAFGTDRCGNDYFSGSKTFYNLSHTSATEQGNYHHGFQTYASLFRLLKNFSSGAKIHNHIFRQDTVE